MLEIIQPWTLEPRFQFPVDKTHASAVHKQQDGTLHRPRILCLHGGGTNARIFRTQCRALRVRLAPWFRLVFAEAPFLSTPGPDVVSVYEKWGPFRSWLPRGHGATGSFTCHSGTTESLSPWAIQRIELCLRRAMQEDDNAGATGPWMGVLGFSQGAKMAASLLLRQQKQNHKLQSQPGGRASFFERTTSTSPPSKAAIDYRFAILLAGRAPMVSLDVEREFDAYPEESSLLRLPTLHVHGTRDPGLPLHRELLQDGCEEDTTRLIEWEGEHRVPIRTKDVVAVVDAILDLARDTGVVD